VQCITPPKISLPKRIIMDLRWVFVLLYGCKMHVHLVHNTAGKKNKKSILAVHFGRFADWQERWICVSNYIFNVGDGLPKSILSSS